MISLFQISILTYHFLLLTDTGELVVADNFIGVWAQVVVHIVMCLVEPLFDDMDMLVGLMHFLPTRSYASILSVPLVHFYYTVGKRTKTTFRSDLTQTNSTA